MGPAVAPREGFCEHKSSGWGLQVRGREEGVRGGCYAVKVLA